MVPFDRNVKQERRFVKIKGNVYTLARKWRDFLIQYNPETQKEAQMCSK